MIPVELAAQEPALLFEIGKPVLATLDQRVEVGLVDRAGGAALRSGGFRASAMPGEQQRRHEQDRAPYPACMHHPNVPPRGPGLLRERGVASASGPPPTVTEPSRLARPGGAPPTRSAGTAAARRWCLTRGPASSPILRPHYGRISGSWQNAPLPVRTWNCSGAGTRRPSATPWRLVIPARRGRGFTLQPFTAADPSLPPICGLARTGQIRAAAPSGRSKDQDKRRPHRLVRIRRRCRPADHRGDRGPG